MERKELAVGSVLYGKYKIECILGSGGFGITYYAKHITLEHYYAIKEFFINGSCIRNTNRYSIRIQGITENEYNKYKTKFLEEARTLAKLDHPNIVRVTDVFEENNTSYLVMPFVNGVTLQNFIDKHGPMDYVEAINLIAQITEAVGYIHQRNILHLDIKPDNIILTPDNRAILIDFGSAREYIQDKTQRFTSILTKGYAPIEQYDSNKTKGTYTDIYSVGCVAYYVLTGTKPIDATVRVIDTTPTPRDLNNKIPKAISDVIMHAMELQADKRHQTADQFLNDLLNAPRKKHKRKSKALIILLLFSCICLGIYYCGNNIIKTDKSKYEKLLAECDSLYIKGMNSFEILPNALEKSEEAIHFEKKYFGLFGFENTAQDMFNIINAEINKKFDGFRKIAINSYQYWNDKKDKSELKIAKKYAEKALILKDDEMMKKIINTNID